MMQNIPTSGSTCWLQTSSCLYVFWELIPASEIGQSEDLLCSKALKIICSTVTWRVSTSLYMVPSKIWVSHTYKNNHFKNILNQLEKWYLNQFTLILDTFLKMFGCLIAKPTEEPKRKIGRKIGCYCQFHWQQYQVITD